MALGNALRTFDVSLAVNPIISVPPYENAAVTMHDATPLKPDANGPGLRQYFPPTNS